MLHLSPEERSIVDSILEQYASDYKVLAYGSRVHGNNLKPFSDLDLTVVNNAPLPAETISELRYAFSESDLPFKVDISEFSLLDKAFQDLIEKEHIPLNT